MGEKGDTDEGGRRAREMGEREDKYIKLTNWKGKKVRESLCIGPCICIRFSHEEKMKHNGIKTRDEEDTGRRMREKIDKILKMQGKI